MGKALTTTPYSIEGGLGWIGRHLGIQGYGVVYGTKIQAGRIDRYLVAEFDTHAEALEELRRLNAAHRASTWSRPTHAERLDWARA